MSNLRINEQRISSMFLLYFVNVLYNKLYYSYVNMQLLFRKWFILLDFGSPGEEYRINIQNIFWVKHYKDPITVMPIAEKLRKTLLFKFQRSLKQESLGLWLLQTFNEHVIQMIKLSSTWQSINSSVYFSSYQ